VELITPRRLYYKNELIMIRMKWTSGRSRICLVLWCLMPLSTIFSYIMAVSFIGGGNRSAPGPF